MGFPYDRFYLIVLALGGMHATFLARKMRIPWPLISSIGPLPSGIAQQPGAVFTCGIQCITGSLFGIHQFHAKIKCLGLAVD